MLTSTINLTIFIMMIIIYLNEMRNISTFVYNFHYIKDLSRIIMTEKCNSVYCEAETDRYQMAKNSYKLLLPNDIFNSKTYIIFTFIVAILIYIYFYFILFNSGDNDGGGESDANYYVLNLLMLALLLGIIIYRYVPNDETGYLNYFGKVNDTDSFSSTFKLYILVLLIAITRVIFLIKRKQAGSEGLLIMTVKYLCFMFAIILLFNLMNIVMTFRNNKTPILKTKSLVWSLKNSFEGMLDKFSLTQIAHLNKDISDEYKKIIYIKQLLATKEIADTDTISAIIDVLLAFEELSTIVIKNYGGIDSANSINLKYIIDLKKIINDKTAKIIEKKDGAEAAEQPTVSNLSLIYDKFVKIPHHYNADEHSTNNNENNTDYVYTADISYDNANLFYEKYWDLNANTGDFLYNYDYFVSSFLFGGYRPNLFKILIVIVIFIVVIYILALINGIILVKHTAELTELFNKVYSIIYPLILFVILITYILLFIRFNTMFNSSVIYKCLDSSYKRSLNKLNNVVVPYIRMYDNKILKGNKNYLQHYIITNVFYSILSGNIKLAANTEGKSIINEPQENENYYDIPRIKSTRLKLTTLNSSVLSNDNEFREYYKAKFENLYKDGYDKKHAESIYEVFRHLFGADSTIRSSEAGIDAYFKEIISRDNILKIYLIIKKCVSLFNEETFNNNLIYYNNHENKQKGVNIDAYNKFKFYKYGDKVIPYKFILKLNTFTDYTEFVKDINVKVRVEFDKNIADYFSPTTSLTSLTNILDNSTDSEDLLSQAADLENKKDKNLIILITMYLLILAHINYNRIEYNSIVVDANANTSAITAATARKKAIYEKKTTYLYKLISNILYDDTYDIDDTFVTNSDSNSNTNGIVSISLTNGGSGYTTPPTINLIPVEDVGTGAVAEALLTRTPIRVINITNGGAGYITAPTINIRGGGATIQATATATINQLRGIITGIQIVTAGSGYTKVPTIDIIGGGGTSAIAEAILNSSSVESIQITNEGSGYTTAPAVNITGGGGTGATAVALNSLLIGGGEYEKYKHLSYIYNYLETRFVNISANNNKNYLANIIKGINNKISDSSGSGDEDKIMNMEGKSSMYMFNDNINLMKTPEEYENEDEVLNAANNVSTGSLATTYVFNIILIIVYFKVISANIK